MVYFEMARSRVLTESRREDGQEHLHCLFVLADEFGGEFTQNLQEGQVDGRKLWSPRVLVLKCKLYSIPEEREKETEGFVSKLEIHYLHNTKVKLFTSVY